MYYAHFGLSQAPFRVTPDRRMFFPGAKRGAVLDALVYAILNGEAIIKVVGEVGSGKTMLCRMLEARLPERVDIIYLANPNLDPEHILQAIALELRLPTAESWSRLQVMHALQQLLLRKHAQARRVVMFVEEAQSMPWQTMEEIRFLSNLETQHEKLLQIVLFGQPELDALLAQRELRQLRERIAFGFHLGALSVEDVKTYLNNRLQLCGAKSYDLFTVDAVRTLHRYSKGLLRRVNILADKSLLAAYAANASRVSRREVMRAVRDSGFHRRRAATWYEPRSLCAVALGFGLTLGLAVVGHIAVRPANTLFGPAFAKLAKNNQGSTKAAETFVSPNNVP